MHLIPWSAFFSERLPEASGPADHSSDPASRRWSTQGRESRPEPHSPDSRPWHPFGTQFPRGGNRAPVRASSSARALVALRAPVALCASSQGAAGARSASAPTRLVPVGATLRVRAALALPGPHCPRIPGGADIPPVRPVSEGAVTSSTQHAGAAGIADPGRRAPAGGPDGPALAPPRPLVVVGDFITTAEADYCYGTGPLRLRVTHVPDRAEHPALEWVELTGQQLRFDGRPDDGRIRRALVRVAALRARPVLDAPPQVGAR
ncbi:hypothetical protein GA0070616_4061 [Micromonospora nigra]|uniref:Uncharacterized protein n=1 Tax=Micromonospora nigra TaxID=145857 RepID=A0A1C6SLE9_9ACTN|nr:hypothetical protein GA0070616_4061 [Micromonospora nigra]